MKVTKQGIRDLGGNRRQGSPRCQRTGRHLPGPAEVIGQEWRADPFSGWYESYLADVKGRRCIYCRQVVR